MKSKFLFFKKTLSKNNFINNPSPINNIKLWLAKKKINNYEIIKKNDEYIINVNGDVNLNNQKLSSLPFKFGIVKGNFKISNNNLTSFKNFPDVVEKKLLANSNFITSVEGIPKVKSGIYLMKNKIKDISKLDVINNSTINLSYNEIEILDFINLSSYTKIDLSFNKISKIEKLPVASVINLNNNLIKKIDFSLIYKKENSNSLSEIYLTNNLIYDIKNINYFNSFILDNNKLTNLNFLYENKIVKKGNRPIFLKLVNNNINYTKEIKNFDDFYILIGNDNVLHLKKEEYEKLYINSLLLKEKVKVKNNLYKNKI